MHNEFHNKASDAIKRIQGELSKKYISKEERTKMIRGKIQRRVQPTKRNLNRKCTACIEIVIVIRTVIQKKVAHTHIRHK